MEVDRGGGPSTPRGFPVPSPSNSCGVTARFPLVTGLRQLRGVGHQMHPQWGAGAKLVLSDLPGYP